MKRAVLIALCLWPSLAFAQWQVPQYAVPTGLGPGKVGFSNAPPGASGQCLMSNGTSTKPTFQTCPGAGTGGSVTQIICGTGLSGGTITINGTCAVNYGTGANTSAQGNDARIVGALQAASNLSDLANTATARTNLGLGTIAMQAASAVAITGGTIGGLSALAALTSGATLPTNSVYTAVPAKVLQVMQGSVGSPATVVNEPTVTMTRQQSINSADDGSFNPTLYLMNQGAGTQQNVTVTAESFHTNAAAGDNVALYGNALTESTGTRGAFGAFTQAASLGATSSAFAINPSVYNGTGSNWQYLPNQTSASTQINGIDISYGAATDIYGSAAIQIRGGGGNKRFDAGIAFGAGTNDSIRTADIWSNTSGTYILFAQSGTHSHGVNLSGATFLATAFASTGFSVDPSGNEIALSNTATSDERMKIINGPFERGLSDLLKIKPIRFDWKHIDRPNQAGLSAQNVRSAIPEAVTENESGILGVSDRPIVAALINAVKELKADNDNLRHSIRNLQNEKPVSSRLTHANSSPCPASPKPAVRVGRGVKSLYQ